MARIAEQRNLVPLEVTTPSLPAWAISRVAWLGTVDLPGKPRTPFLGHGQAQLSTSERAELQRQRAELEAIVKPGPFNDEWQAKLGLVAKMLLVYPAAGTTEKGAEARGEAYLYALDDLPAWAVNAAIRKWHRGQVGNIERFSTVNLDYRWAPSPAVLRAAVERVLQEPLDRLNTVVTLLEVRPLDELMNEHYLGNCFTAQRGAVESRS